MTLSFSAGASILITARSLLGSAPTGRAGHLRRHRVEHQAHLGGEEIGARAFEVEHAVQAVAMAVAMTDAASSLRCMEDVARYAVGKRPGIPISG